MIERIPAYSNQSMIDYCDTLLSILNLTREEKVGRGKKIQVIKHKKDQDVIDKLTRSKEYYYKLNQMENRKVGSFEVVKYRLDYIDSQPKIIIEMIKVLDEDGEYIKFARLKDVIGYLPKYPITFKKL